MRAQVRNIGNVRARSPTWRTGVHTPCLTQEAIYPTLGPRWTRACRGAAPPTSLLLACLHHTPISSRRVRNAPLPRVSSSVDRRRRAFGDLLISSCPNGPVGEKDGEGIGKVEEKRSITLAKSIGAVILFGMVLIYQAQNGIVESILNAQAEREKREVGEVGGRQKEGDEL